MSEQLIIQAEELPNASSVEIDGHTWQKIDYSDLDSADEKIKSLFDIKKYAELEIWENGGGRKLSLMEKIKVYNEALEHDGINNHGWNHVYRGVALPTAVFLSSLPEYKNNHPRSHYRRIIDVLLSAPAHDIGYYLNTKNSVLSDGVTKDKYSRHGVDGALEFGRVMVNLANGNRKLLHSLYPEERLIYTPTPSAIDDMVQAITYHRLEKPGLTQDFLHSYKSKVLALHFMDKLDYFARDRSFSSFLDSTGVDLFASDADTDIVHKRTPLAFQNRIIYFSAELKKIKVAFEIDLDNVSELGRGYDPNYTYTKKQFFIDFNQAFKGKLGELEIIARCLMGGVDKYRKPLEIHQQGSYLELVFQFREDSEEKLMGVDYLT